MLPGATFTSCAFANQSVITIATAFMAGARRGFVNVVQAGQHVVRGTFVNRAFAWDVSVVNGPPH